MSSFKHVSSSDPSLTPTSRLKRAQSVQVTRQSCQRSQVGAVTSMTSADGWKSSGGRSDGSLRDFQVNVQIEKSVEDLERLSRDVSESRRSLRNLLALCQQSLGGSPPTKGHSGGSSPPDAGPSSPAIVVAAPTESPVRAFSFASKLMSRSSSTRRSSRQKSLSLPSRSRSSSSHGGHRRVKVDHEDAEHDRTTPAAVAARTEIQGHEDHQDQQQQQRQQKQQGEVGKELPDYRLMEWYSTLQVEVNAYYLTKMQLNMMMKDIGMVLDIEDKEMETRAKLLARSSKEEFETMNTQAVQKIRAQDPSHLY